MGDINDAMHAVSEEAGIIPKHSNVPKPYTGMQIELYTRTKRGTHSILQTVCIIAFVIYMIEGVMCKYDNLQDMRTTL